MQKDFSDWSKKKRFIHEKSDRKFYRQREIWWCTLGVNIRSEQDGTGKNYDRPILILKGFNRNTFFCVALTGHKKDDTFSFYLGKIAGTDSSAKLSQVRILDSKRLIRKISTLDEDTFKEQKISYERYYSNEYQKKHRRWCFFVLLYINVY